MHVTYNTVCVCVCVTELRDHVTAFLSLYRIHKCNPYIKETQNLGFRSQFTSIYTA